MGLHTIEDRVERVADIEAVLKDGVGVRHCVGGYQMGGLAYRLHDTSAFE